MDIELVLIILALLGFWMAFVCGRQTGQGAEKLNSALRCTKCKFFFGVEPVWLNRHLKWTFTWFPENQCWSVFVEKHDEHGCNRPTGDHESASITEACQEALKKYERSR